MGVAEQFQNFRNGYLIKGDLMGTISYRYKRITRQLNSDFWNTTSEDAHSRYIGSYGRDSAANGVSDLDMYFKLPVAEYTKYNGYSGNGQSALLQAVRTSLQKTYPTTSLKGDGQVVVIAFNDGITFEILPVFDNTAKTLTFADSNNGGSWKSCDPMSEMSAFAARNTAANHNLKAICRMMRIWKGQCAVPISGMLIDTLAYNFIDTWVHKDKSYLYHDFLVRDFCQYLSQCSSTQTRWNAPGSGSWVSRTGAFETKASTAHQNALKAIDHENKRETWAAKQSWQAIFGGTFVYE